MNLLAPLALALTFLVSPVQAQETRASVSGQASIAPSSSRSQNEEHSLASLLLGSWSSNCASGDAITYFRNGALEGDRRLGRWRIEGDVLTETYTVQADPAEPGETDMRFTRRSTLVLQDDGSILKRGEWLSGGDVPPDVVLMRCEAASSAPDSR